MGIVLSLFLCLRHRAGRGLMAATSAAVLVLPSLPLAVPTPARAADAPPVPVVTNISGLLTVRNAHGDGHEVASTQLLHQGDVVMTGVDALAAVNLSGIGKVRLGSATTAQIFRTHDDLSVRLTSGALCVNADAAHITVAASALTLSAISAKTDFNVENHANGAKVAVYRGAVAATSSGKPVGTYKAGDAFSAPLHGTLKKVASSSLDHDFAGLHCPAVGVAQASPTPAPVAEQTPAASGGGGGGGGGIIGILLGLAAIGAAAGHGGGGGGGGSSPTSPPTTPTPTPSLMPTPTPTPTPTATPPGTLTVNPATLSFDAVGSGNSKTFTASESNYNGTLVAVSDNPQHATVSPATGAGPNQVFTVTPVAGGTAHIIVRDDHGQSATVTVNVAPPGALAVNPAALTFDNARSGPQSFTATEAIYLGPIFARGCAGVAAVDPPTGSGPTQRFTVTPQTPGSCQITVTDDHGGVQSVSVTIYGTLTVSPTSLSFNTLGSSQDITASEPFYSGNFSAVPMNCGGIATVSGTSPTFTVTSVGPGTCTVVVSDGHGGSVSVSVTVAPQPGPLTLRPNSVTFTDVGAANAATVTVSETNYSGAFTIANDTCSGTIATIGAPSSNGPTATIQITPLSTPSGGSCSFAVRDDHGGSATETVTVGPFGAIVANPSSFTLTVGQTAPLTITESNYSGRFTQSGCTGIARLDGTKPNFTITALAPGTCSFTINDDHGQSTMISVTVTAALTVNPTSLQVATGTSGTFTATDSSCGPSDTISASSANTAVATVTPSTAPCSGGATFTVTGVSTGTTTISVTDTLGGTATVSIGVDVPPAALKKRAVVGKHPITAPTAPRKVLPGTPPSGNAPSRPNPSQRPAAQWTVPGVAALIVGTPNLDFILNGAPQAVPVSEAFYNGMFHAMSSNPQSLAVTAACAGPMCTLIATPSKAGSGTIRVSDDRGTVRLIEFTVAGPRQTTPAQPPAKVSAPGAPKSAAPIPPHAP